MNSSVQIGKKLKELRQARSLKQYDVAEGVGLSRASISNIEKGRRSVTLETLKKFCNFYNVDISYFEIETDKNEVIDIIERSRKIFESDIDEEIKEDLYLALMTFYMQTKKKL